MCTLAVHWGWLDTVPGFPDRLRENPPRQGFFEHPYAVVVSVVAVCVICLLRLALLGFLALGPVFLHPEADGLLGGVRHRSPLRNCRLRGC